MSLSRVGRTSLRLPVLAWVIIGVLFLPRLERQQRRREREVRKRLAEEEANSLGGEDK
jgi:preprotein translocase subunit YajC